MDCDVPNRNPDTYSDPYTDYDADADTDADSDAYAYADPYTDSDADPDAVADTNANSNPGADTNANAYQAGMHVWTTTAVCWVCMCIADVGPVKRQVPIDMSDTCDPPHSQRYGSQ